MSQSMTCKLAMRPGSGTLPAPPARGACTALRRGGQGTPGARSDQRAGRPAGVVRGRAVQEHGAACPARRRHPCLAEGVHSGSERGLALRTRQGTCGAAWARGTHLRCQRVRHHVRPVAVFLILEAGPRPEVALERIALGCSVCQDFWRNHGPPGRRLQAVPHLDEMARQVALLDGDRLCRTEHAQRFSPGRPQSATRCVRSLQWNRDAPRWRARASCSRRPPLSLTLSLSNTRLISAWAHARAGRKS
jgi:hypothetical protein